MPEHDAPPPVPVQCLSCVLQGVAEDSDIENDIALTDRAPAASEPQASNVTSLHASYPDPGVPLAPDLGATDLLLRRHTEADTLARLEATVAAQGGLAAVQNTLLGWIRGCRVPCARNVIPKLGGSKMWF